MVKNGPGDLFQELGLSLSREGRNQDLVVGELEGPPGRLGSGETAAKHWNDPAKMEILMTELVGSNMCDCPLQK